MGSDPTAAWFGPGLTAGAGAQFRLVRGSDGQVVARHEGRLARLLEAELASPDGPALRFLLKLPRDLPATGPRGRAPLRNPDLDAHWTRELARHARIASPAVLATVPLPPALRELPPLAFCRRQQLYFPIGCPTTGARLAVCRDDARLAQAGLPEYATSAVRYLAAADPAARVFYRVRTEAPERPRPGVTVVEADAWVAGLALLLASDPAAAPVQHAAAWLPCVACPERTRCYSRDAAGQLPAAQELEIVSFYGGPTLGLLPADGDFDALCDQLGVRAPTAAESAAPPWLFAADPRRWPIEVLWTKVRALEQLVAGVRAVHEQTGGAHFGLVPGNVLAHRVAPPGTPWPWAVRVVLGDLGCGSESIAPTGLRRTLPGPEWREDLRWRPYASPRLDDGDGPGAHLPLAVREVADAGGGARLVVELELAGAARRCRPGDQVAIAIAAPERELWCTVTAVRPRGATVEAPLPSAAVRAALAAARTAACTFHAVVDAPLDTFALGMLLLRALVANDATAIEDVRECVDAQLPRWQQGLRAAAGEPARLGHGAELRQRFPDGAWLQTAADRDDPAVRSACGEPLLVRTYTGLLELAGRLLLAQETHPALADATALLAQVAEELSRHAASLEVELLRASQRDRRLHGLLTAALAGAEPTTAAAAPRPGTVVDAAASSAAWLEVQKDGAAEVQRFPLTTLPASIGRSAENTLCLADAIVSSRHAVCARGPDGYTITDLGSRNGTEVEGVRLPVEVPFPLGPGLAVRIAPFTLRLRLAAGVGEETLAGVQGSPLELLAALQAGLAPVLAAGDEAEEGALEAVFGEFGLQAGEPAALALLEQVRGELERRLPRSLLADGPARAADPGVLLFALAQQVLGERPKAADLVRLAPRLGSFARGAADLLAQLLRFRDDLRTRFALTGKGEPSVWVPPRDSGRLLLRSWLLGEAAPEALEPQFAALVAELVAVVDALRDSVVAIRSLAAAEMAPDKLLAAAGGGAINGLATKAPVWKKHHEAWAEVAQGQRFLAVIEQELKRLVAERWAGGG